MCTRNSSPGLSSSCMNPQRTVVCPSAARGTGATMMCLLPREQSEGHHNKGRKPRGRSLVSRVAVVHACQSVDALLYANTGIMALIRGPCIHARAHTCIQGCMPAHVPHCIAAMHVPRCACTRHRPRPACPLHVKPTCSAAPTRADMAPDEAVLDFVGVPTVTASFWPILQCVPTLHAK